MKFTDLFVKRPAPVSLFSHGNYCPVPDHPSEFVINTTSDYPSLAQLVDQLASETFKKGGDCSCLLEAISESASVRLRPVLMTTAAMVLGVVPLILASGAGAVSRFNIGLVIATGMTVGTLFTLFVVPVVYSYVAKDHQKIKAEAVGVNPGSFGL